MPLTGSMSLDKSLYFSRPLFPQMQIENGKIRLDHWLPNCVLSGLKSHLSLNPTPNKAVFYLKGSHLNNISFKERALRGKHTQIIKDPSWYKVVAS